MNVAASSRDLRASVTVDVAGDIVQTNLTRESSLGEALAHPVAGPLIRAAMAQMMEGLEGIESVMPEGVSRDKMMLSFPIGRMSMMGGDVTPEMIDGLIALANAPQER